MMTVNRKCRRFHDPWGNDQGNTCGHVVGYQYLVSKAELRNTKTSGCIGRIDLTKLITHQYDRFVKGSRVETLRR